MGWYPHFSAGSKSAFQLDALTSSIATSPGYQISLLLSVRCAERASNDRQTNITAAVQMGENLRFVFNQLDGVD